jgi:peptidoglycan-N-acetylglucosamine deacetylase
VRELEAPQISRRNFLKGAAALGIAVGISASLPIEVFASKKSPIKEPEATNEALVGERIYSPGEIVKRGDPNIPNIFLTFDDDWRNVPRILDIARGKNVKITFFPVGIPVSNNKPLWKDVLLEGHTVENHTWSHKNLNKITKEEVRTQIVRQRDLVEELAYIAGVKDSQGNDYKQVFLRGPGGYTNLQVQEIARQLNLVIARWTISSGDTNSTNTEDKIYHNVVDRLKNGAIVLKHAKVKTINVLPAIIDNARTRGFAMDKNMRDGIPTTVYSS